MTYDGYDELVASGDIDAVYIATPNNLHRDYAVRAAQAGVHVLCEKPLARTEDECQAMIHAADQHDVELMTAYRLHFEEANTKAVELAHDGTLGDVRLFDSVFTQDVKAGDMRLDFEKGGGTLHDQGIYCINAARYLFRAEPTSVFARSASRDDERFRAVDEMTAVTLTFPGDWLATFPSSA
ncbi:MAG: Gfo/Idh/MocA family protein [Myxococcota bacterium]